MNPDYFEKLLENYPDFDDWDLRCREKQKWYEKMIKKKEYYNDFIKDDLEWPNFYEPYFEKINDLSRDLQPKPPPSPVDLKVGQLVRFCDDRGEVGIIVDTRQLIGSEVQVMVSGDQLIWTLGHTVEVIGEDR